MEPHPRVGWAPYLGEADDGMYYSAFGLMMWVGTRRLLYEQGQVRGGLQVVSLSAQVFVGINRRVRVTELLL